MIFKYSHGRFFLFSNAEFKKEVKKLNYIRARNFWRSFMKNTVINSKDTRGGKISGIDYEVKPENSSFLKRILIWLVALITAFLIGLIPMWLSKREAVNERKTAQTNLRISQMENRLATATIIARRGEYEQARILTSQFFTDLHEEIELPASAFNENQIGAFQTILSQRDEIITLLARSDPASAERLADLYAAYKKAEELSRATNE
jgi:hypothetical protein